MTITDRPRPAPRPLWRNRDYLLLWTGQTVSSVGSGVSGLAFPLLALALTKSPAVAGLLGATRALPYLLVSLPAGALADRWNRKRAMWICDVVRSLALASIALGLLLGVLTLLHLFLVAFIEGLCFVLFDVAQVASLPQVVAPHQVATAYGQNQATTSLAALIAPALGGFLYTLRQVVPFAVDALSFLISIGSLLAIRTHFQEERQHEAFHLGRDIQEGVVWLWKQPLLLCMACLTGGTNLVFAGIDLLLIVLLQQRGASATLIGVTFALGGLGGIIGSVVGGAVQQRFRFQEVVLVTMWATVVVWAGYLFAPNIYVIGATSAAILCLSVIYNVVVVSYRLRLIPDALQGRVNSIYRFITYGSLPLGTALAGWLAQRIGVEGALLIDAAILILLALTATVSAQVRHAAALPVVA